MSTDTTTPQSGGTVFVSGCYDVLHAGHLAFLEDAKALGDRLIVSVASDAGLAAHKDRVPALPVEHKVALLRALAPVDDVVVGTSQGDGLDFAVEFRRLKPDVLAVTEDDRFADAKRALCEETGARYVVLPKREPAGGTVSTTDLRRRLSAPASAPVRVDFAGGWLDVPRHAIDGAFVVNCTVTPMITRHGSPYRHGGGVGGSAAWAVLQGQDALAAELSFAGWQDPACVLETGLCVWRSGERPVLHTKHNPDWLRGRMALLWTGTEHRTADHVDRRRDYRRIAQAGRMAAWAAASRDLAGMGAAVNETFKAQRGEGMADLPWPDGCMGRKYCGSGHGGYALFLFFAEQDRAAWFAGCERDGAEAIAIEPFLGRFAE